MSSQASPQGNSLSPLFRMAAITGVKASIMFHLHRGADVNATDEKGRSPLVFAAARGHAEICQILLEAGADPALKDAEGQDALSIAITKGHKEVEAVLRLYAPLLSTGFPTMEAPVDLEIQAKLPIEVESAFLCSQEKEIEADGSTFDLSSWEEDTDSPPPPNDSSCLASADEIQRRISRHVPIDIDEDWSEVYIELPEFITTRRRRILDEDEPWLISVREIILDGLRDGWVTTQQIAKAYPPDDEDDQLPDADFEAAFRIVLEDLGILVDDDVPDALNFPSPVDGIDEDLFYDDANVLIVDEAITHLRYLLSDTNDPLAKYLMDVGLRQVLSRDEEIALINEIKEGSREAFWAIASSPAAMAEILELAERIESGVAPLHAMISGSMDNEDDQLSEPNNMPNDVELEDDAIVSGDNDDETQFVHANHSTTAIPPDFSNRINHIRNLQYRITVDQTSSEDSTLSEILRDEIFELGLSINFVSRLWALVRRDEINSEVRSKMESGLARAQAAKQKFAEANLRLVLWMAKKFRGLPLMDLVQEGNFGLLKAIDRFDPSHGAKFATYGTWWIRQSISRAIEDKKRLIRLPVHMIESIRKVEKFIDAAIVLTGYPPTANALSDSLGLPLVQAQNIMDILEDPISIDMSSDIGRSLAECVEDKTKSSPEDQLLQADLRRVIEEEFKALKKKEARVLRLRFGIGVNRDHTLEEIGQICHVTRERIRQIEKKALAKLCHPCRAERLRCFLISTA